MIAMRSQGKEDDLRCRYQFAPGWGSYCGGVSGQVLQNEILVNNRREKSGEERLCRCQPAFAPGSGYSPNSIG